MKAKDLAKQLLENPDFDVKFSFSRIDDSEYGMTIESFKDISICDIGYSSKTIILSGEVDN